MLATVIVLYSLSLQVTYVQSVFRRKHGQSWSETVCSKCNHVGLQDSTMGNTKLRHILATTNTPPPSRSGMQRTSNRVATITYQSTTDDLQQKREKTREINVLRGLPASAPINISMDVRYNSTSLKTAMVVDRAQVKQWEPRLNGRRTSMRLSVFTWRTSYAN